MKQATILSAATILSTALAAPAYIPYAINSSEPTIHNKPIAANNGLFWINKPVTATCPSYDPSCPSANTTIISGPTGDACCPNWWMGILEAGGQQVFTTGPSSGGPVGYAAADSSNLIAYRSEESLLSAVNSTDGQTLLLKFSNTEDFSGCDDGTGALRVITAQDNASCVPFAIELRETTAPAVQYYDCVGCETRCNRQDGCH